MKDVKALGWSQHPDAEVCCENSQLFAGRSTNPHPLKTAHQRPAEVGILWVCDYFEHSVVLWSGTLPVLVLC